MFTVKADLKKDTLYIGFRGNFNAKQGPQFCLFLEKEVKRMKPGFSVITDLTYLNYMGQDSIPFIEKAMDICREKGILRVLRIIPDRDKDIGFNIMSTFHYPSTVKIHTFKSTREMERYLALLTDARVGRRFLASLWLLRSKVLGVTDSMLFRMIALALGFSALILLRLQVHSFGVSLGYLYITLISLSGFWFGLKGGIISASASSLILVSEVLGFHSWEMRDAILQGIHVRVAVYYLSGFLLGCLSSAQEKLRKKLEYQAGHDHLTGAANFKLITDTLEKEFNRSRRYKKDLSIALLDIDGFKKINDGYGHLIGNDILKAFAQVLKKNLRSEDSIGRYGGDEFMIVFPEANWDQAADVLERVKKKLKNFKVNSGYGQSDKVFDLTFSAGIAVLDNHMENTNVLIRNADKALYESKGIGQDHIVVYEGKKKNK